MERKRSKHEEDKEVEIDATQLRIDYGHKMLKREVAVT